MRNLQDGKRLVEDERLRAIQARLTVAFLVTYVAATTTWAAGWLWPAPQGSEPQLAALAALVLVLPVLLAALSRYVMRRIEGLDAERVRLYELYARARMDALVDGLTGLGNHRAFQEELVRQLEVAGRYHFPLALLLIDVDDLKRVNEERGHAGGDEVLAAVGRVVTANQRRNDRSFRIGGDEFAVLLPQADARTAANLARRLLAAALGGGDPGQPVTPFSMSIGVSSFPGSGQGHQLYRQADTALYWAKRHGRTCVEVYDAARHAPMEVTQLAAETGTAIDQIIATRSLRPVYQPIFSLRTGEPIGLEGLVRPGEGTAFGSALSLFEAAARSGRAVELDLACVDELAGRCGPLPQGQFLSINLSPATVEAEGFAPGDLTSILARHRIDPNRVVLELTEREVVRDIDRLRRNLAACRKAGFRIAVDDVGAGNAGLRLLSEIRFDIVKIDLSLVQGGASGHASRLVLEGLRDHAVHSKASVVAEGVETAEQLAMLRSLGVDAGQGYLLGRPSQERHVRRLDLDDLLGAAGSVSETRLFPEWAGNATA